MQLSSRSRRLAGSAASVAGARVVTVLCSFASIPICLQYLGVEAFGAWATITSVLGLLAFADLGIGNGILSPIGAAFGINDRQRIREIIASALTLLTGIAALAFAIFVAVFPLIAWDTVFGVRGVVAPEQIAAAAFVLGAAFVLNLPTSVIQRTQFALQMGHLNGATQAGAGVLGLALIAGVAQTRLGLAGMVAAVLAAPILATWISAVWMRRAVPQYLPRRNDVKRNEMRSVLQSGLKFFVLGLAFCLCQTSDNLVAAHVLGPEAVASFAVHQKYLAPIAFLAGLVLTPLWPAYAEALSRRDIRWIRKAFIRSVAAFAIVGLVLSLVLVAALEPFFALWLRGRVAGDHTLAAAMCLWVSVELVGKAVTMFLHGVGLVSEQLWLAVIYVPVCLALKIGFAWWLGLAGIPLGTCLAYAIVHGPAYVMLARRWHRDNPVATETR